MPNPSRGTADGTAARPPHARVALRPARQAQGHARDASHACGASRVDTAGARSPCSPSRGWWPCRRSCRPLLIGRIIDGIDLHEPVAILIGLLLALYAGKLAPRASASSSS